MKRLCLVLMFVLFATPVVAQTPVNPQAWVFDHVDHAVTDGYVFGWFAGPTTPAPVQEASIPKPGSCSPCAITQPLPSSPIGFQTWHGAVRAVAGSATSEWSNRVPFVNALRAPTNLQAK